MVIIVRISCLNNHLAIKPLNHLIMKGIILAGGSGTRLHPLNPGRKQATNAGLR